MRFSKLGLAIAAEEPRRTARWFADHFGFQVGVDIGWYVSTWHEGHDNLALDIVHRDHDTWPADQGKEFGGALVGLLVEDVDAEEKRLREEGVEVVLPLVTEPWGQRRFQVRGPDRVLVELLQLVEPDPKWLAEQGLA